MQSAVGPPAASEKQEYVYRYDSETGGDGRGRGERGERGERERIILK